MSTVTNFGIYPRDSYDSQILTYVCTHMHKDVVKLFFHSVYNENKYCKTQFPLLITEPKKDKTDGTAQNGALSPSGDMPSPVLHPPGMDSTTGKPERPNSLGPGNFTRRLLCYHSEHCKYPHQFRHNVK